MKFTTSFILSIAAVAAAAPADITYPAPPGGWDKVDYPDGIGAGKNDVPKGGWESVDYSGGKAPAAAPAAPAAPGNAGSSPFVFTSSYHVSATPDQVVNGTTPTGGLKGASGTFDFGINSFTNTICYNITLYGFEGNYQSPALTATHIHQSAKGASGPPRIAFPNPSGTGHVRNSIGCIVGPFKTGVMVNGADSGDGFHVSQIEAAPQNFNADVHSSLAVPGAVRGQLA
ncbi:hypothetical protein AAFC00_001964 [Neodothiora populina]|uniref:CHRD domain-containing protein n=1 Tax=Neodothiora populina TaxID=2781224 RepID=A0ABR3PQP8_9PEZI